MVKEETPSICFFAENAVNVDLTVGTVTGGITATLESVESVYGTLYDDTFAFSQPSAGDSFEVIGVSGNNTIDLSGFSQDDIEISNGMITGQVDGGQFQINFMDISSVIFAEGTVAIEDVDSGFGGPPANEAPVAVDDSFETSFNTPVNLDLVANDQDADGDELSVAEIVEMPEHGTVSLTDGGYVYVPNDGFSGTDTVVYRVTDGNGGSHTATATIQVLPAPAGNTPASGNLVIAGEIGSYDIETNENGELIVRNIESGETTLADSFATIEFENQTIDIAQLLADGNASSNLTVDGVTSILAGGAGHDGLIGDENDNVLHGGSGDDQLEAGSGDNRLFGGTGEDVLYAGDGASLLDGGDGEDIAYFDGSIGDYDIELNEHGDVVVRNSESGKENIVRNIETMEFDDESIDVSALLAGGNLDDQITGGQDDQVSGGSGDDALTGDDDDDLIVGGSGNDSASGGEGDDQVFGGTGDDDLSGNAGNDFLFGGSGNDNLSGGTGNDQLFGGAGDDVFDAGSGFDVVDGGRGTDTLKLSGSVSQFLITQRFDGSFVLSDGNSENDKILYDVENVTFDDMTITEKALELTTSATGEAEDLLDFESERQTVEITAENIESEEGFKVLRSKS